MRLSYKNFSARENRKARERLRLVSPDDAAKVGYKHIFHTIPFLIRLINRIDAVVADDPEAALALAEPLPELAKRMKVGGGTHYYTSESERQDFILYSKAVLFSVQFAAGHAEMALRDVNETLQAARRRGVDSFATAEVLRRAAYVALQSNRLELAKRLAEEATPLLLELKEFERVAFVSVYLGQVEDLSKGIGHGMRHYSRALYYGAKSKTDRGARAVAAAASCLARDAVFASSFPDEAIKWASAAKEAMKGRPNSVAKLQVAWVEALASYRAGLGRYAATHLESVRNQLLKLGAVPEAVACTADLLEVVSSYEPEDFGEVAQRSEEALKNATSDSEMIEVIESWASRPSDVVRLRRLLAPEEPCEANRLE